MLPWSEVLDANAAGQDDARFLSALRLPSIDGWETGKVWTTWPVEVDFLTPVGASLFGGYIAALADHFLALAAFTVLADTESLATSELHIHFLRPVRMGELKIESRVVSRGKHSAYCEALFTDSAGILVARAGATQTLRAAK